MRLTYGKTYAAPELNKLQHNERMELLQRSATSGVVKFRWSGGGSSAAIPPRSPVAVCGREIGNGGFRAGTSGGR